MKLSFLMRSSSSRPKSPWPWPYCHQPRTLSFTLVRNKNNPRIPSSSQTFSDEVENELPESFFTNSSESPSFSCTSSSSDNLLTAADCSVETLIRGLRSERLFFDPEETSHILPEPANKEGNNGGNGGVSFGESVALSMESEDPFGDFRKSMEEMIEAYKLKDWENLEELLAWYLEVNGKSNHRFIIGAFVDLLLGLALSSSSSSSLSCDGSDSNSSEL